MSETEEKKDDDDNLDHLTQPPHIDVPREHVLWVEIEKGLKEIYDPEIPVNIYELGLIYSVKIMAEENGVSDVKVEMSLTSPACPVAQEMPSWVQGAILPIDGVGGVEVEVIWEPQWNPSMMAETAKMQRNMFM
ncbi:MAG: iron-sulfur cluster assembly protein [Robiginitomaculum sp.]|nr:iron-sulfur cluster assembly protein [Robiginitomaculum sp.]